MTTASSPDDELHRPVDPAQLGADQGPGSAPEDAPQDLSPVMARPQDDALGGAPRRHTPGTEQQASGTATGSDFDERRRQGAAGAPNGDVGRGTGMGRAGVNGDEDRGYEPSGHRGGLGTSGGREDLSDRNFDADGNPFTGGYGGGDYDRPDEAQLKQMGMNSQNPTDAPAASDAAASSHS